MKDLSKYKILTPDGFKHFSDITKKTKSDYLVITLSNGEVIKSSLNHKFIIKGEKVYAIDLKCGDKLDNLKNDSITIIHIDLIENEDIDLYDIINVENHLFVIDKNIIISNCDASFLSSGTTVITPEDIDFCNKNFVKEPIEKRGKEFELHIFDYPDPTHTYIVSADVARGDGSDNSAFHVLDVQDNGFIKQVAEFKSKIDTDSYANVLFNIATEYNNAYLVVENNSVGWAVINKLIDLRYNKLYYTYKSDPYLDVMSQIKKGYDLKNKEDMVPGFTTTSAIRALMIEKTEEYLRERTLILQSKRTIHELQTFVYHNNKAQAMGGYNDDLIISLAIGLWVRETALRVRQYGMNLTKSALNGIRRSGLGSSALYKAQGREYWGDNNTLRGEQNDTSVRWLL